MKRILITVCIAGVMLASCNKDIPDKNVFKLDGVEKEVVTAISMEYEGEVGIDFDLIDNTHGFLKNLQSCVGKTVELGKVVSGVEYSIGCNGTPQLYTMLDKGKLEYNDFKSGKMTIKKVKEGGHRLTIDAVLLGGQTLYIDLYAEDENSYNSHAK